MIFVKIQNVSTVLSDADLAPILAAIEAQVKEDVCPVWGCQRLRWVPIPWTNVYDPAFWQFVVCDNSDQAGALGYHETLSNNKAIGFAFLKDTIADGLSPSVTISHEALEMMIDGHINTSNQSSSTEFDMQEVCDPVEDDSLGYQKNGVQVSDFITPAWFQPGVDGPYDFMKHLTAPLSLAPGGYRSYWTPSTGWTQQTDDRKAQSLRFKMSRYSRRARRKAKFVFVGGLT